MNYLYRGWEAEGSLNHPLVQKKSHCVFSKAQKQSQDKTVVGSSLTPHAASLVHPSGTIHPVVDYHEFTWSDKCCFHRITDLIILSPVRVTGLSG